jgi:hypothetical protein
MPVKTRPDIQTPVRTRPHIAPDEVREPGRICPQQKREAAPDAL